jgi:hypothetical protein
MLDEQRLAQIKQRARAATPGPWEARNLESESIWDGYPEVRTATGTYVAQTVYDNLDYSVEHNVEEDTLFIAHARQDVPDLVAAYEEALAELARLREQLSACPA